MSHSFLTLEKFNSANPFLGDARFAVRVYRFISPLHFQGFVFSATPFYNPIHSIEGIPRSTSCALETALLRAAGAL
jgi:hypothetical protein